MKASVQRIKDKIEDDARQRNAADLPLNFARPLPAVDASMAVPAVPPSSDQIAGVGSSAQA